MPEIIDFFFSPYPTPQEKRLRAALQDGLAHDSRIEPPDPEPEKPVKLLFSTNAARPIERVAVYYTTDGTTPVGERGVVTHGVMVLAEPGERIYDQKMAMLVQHWHAELPGQPDGTLVRYRVDGWSEGHHWYADSADPIAIAPEDGRIFAYHVDRWHAPDWFADAVIYHIFIDRFSAANSEPPMQEVGEITGFFGGTLAGVLAKLAYIQALGANCIWLSPVFESPSPHGYNASDYHTVARRYGTNETLRELIAEAHRRGMRVLLDFVTNHTSHEHPAFLAAQADPTGPMAKWYIANTTSPHGYRSYASVHTMPELVTEHPDVQRYLIDAALHWLGYFGVDGLRLDYAPGPPHAFWTLFQRAIKQHFPAALTLGEITSPLAEIASYAGRMDAFMDFSLTRMLRLVFALRKATLQALLLFLDQRLPELPPHMGRATMLDNHDMHRFLWLSGGDKARLQLAATCHMTLEGVPVIYYGTEVGLSQYGDAHQENAYARAPMFWDERQDMALLAHYQRLIALRHQYLALRHGSRLNVKVEVVNAGSGNEDQVGAYLRFMQQHDQLQENTESLLIVINNGERAVNIRIHLLEQLKAAGIKIPLEARMRDVLAIQTSQAFALVDGSVELTLPALSAVVFVITDE